MFCGVCGECFTQTPAGLPGWNDDEEMGEIERTVPGRPVTG